MAAKSHRSTKSKKSRASGPRSARGSRSSRRPGSTSAVAAALAASSSRSAAPVVKTVASTSTSISQLTNMFIAFLIGNSVVVYLANMLFPTQVVLGTHLISPMIGLLYSTILMTVAIVAAVPVIEWVVQQWQIKLTDTHWMLLYLILNTVIIWGVARLAEMIGFGIASWVVALILGIIFDVVQGLLVKTVIYSQD